MAGASSIYVVDDDPTMVTLISQLLSQAGHRVLSTTSSSDALDKIVAVRPDAVLLDIMMPGIDGLELCRRLRAQPSLSETKLVMVSSKSYDLDRRRARALGANGYITKPIQPGSFVRQIQELLSDQIELRYWGVRGTLPVAGPRSARFGGNTSCVTMRFQNEELFIFDAGSGIKELSNHLMSQGSRHAGRIFISHPHWDHINALPFFAPLYIQGNQFQILGSGNGDRRIQDLLAAQMDDIYFPITMREFGASLSFRDLREETLEFDGIVVKTMLLQHPGYCLGFRVGYGGHSVCYITDNELFPPSLPQHDPFYLQRLTEFVRGTDVLITDTNYTDEAYPAKVGWGHSAVGQVVELAHAAEVGELHLFHHDPDQSDEDIDRKLESAVTRMQKLGSATRVVAPPEGTIVNI